MRRDVWYDVTEYECWIRQSSRRSKSSLELLSSLTNAEVESTNARNFFNWPVFLTWKFVMFKMNKPLFALWFLWRVGVTLTVYFVNPVLFHENLNSNSTSECTGMYASDIPISIIIVTYVAGILLLDIFEYVVNIRRKHISVTNGRLFEDYATHHGFYRFVRRYLFINSTFLVLQHLLIHKFNRIKVAWCFIF